MKTNQQWLSDLILGPEGREKLQAIYADVMAPKEKRTCSLNCPRCGMYKKVDIYEPKYDMKEIALFLKWASEFGIAKPAQKIEEIRQIDVTHRVIQELSDEELLQLAAAEDAEIED